MNEEHIRSSLKRWHESMQECDLRMSELSELTGQFVESPLGDAVYHVMGEYTKAVAELIGWDNAVLEDWWCSHNFGEKPMAIGFSGEPMQRIETIDQLADFIIDDLRRGEQ